ncbi:MAG TPA: hypothetical protein VNC17_01020, partial [Thermoleophilaceae bacterium]|nr:hypothetical protein [Thermoleophilaceae bacterium]
ARNARRLVQAARKQDRRLSAALLAAALAHTPEAQQVLDGARMRMARKPSALARELLKNFPKGKRRRGGRRRRKKGGGEAEGAEADVPMTQETPGEDQDAPGEEQDAPGEEQDAPGEPEEDKAPKPKRARRRRSPSAAARARNAPSEEDDPDSRDDSGEPEERDAA